MIYYVEDDNSIRELVVYTLSNTGFEALGLESGRALRRALETRLPELILLDIMLPGEDGMAILRWLKTDAVTRDIPVVMLTAKSAEYDKVIGLDGGADDFITKPFGMMELVSRVKAVLRRASPTRTGRISVGAIELDAQKHTVVAGGEPVQLTLKEFELLRILMENAGIVLSRERLLELVWGYQADVETRTVDVHVRTLRQKLGANGGAITTVRGIGYKI
jgi:two-component system alkaline phosphatase synthesis response regulator PhoP